MSTCRRHLRTLASSGGVGKAVKYSLAISASLEYILDSVFMVEFSAGFWVAGSPVESEEYQEVIATTKHHETGAVDGV